MFTLTPHCHVASLRRTSPTCRAVSAPTSPPPTISTAPSIPSRADPATLRSTWPHRAWVAAGSAAVLSSLSTSATLAAASGSVLEPLLAGFLGYSLADLGTGVYHWFIDNYGDASTPVFGAQIEAFQGHHKYPSTITIREPCNNLHALARAVAFVAPVVDTVAAGDSAAAHAFVGTCSACIMLSQQFHAWAHEKRRRLPAAVEALQAARVLVSRAEHAAHHRPPYSTNYCIVSGMWNGVLDKYRVFEVLELVVFFRSGVRPRSWAEPEASWREDSSVGGDGDEGDDGLR